MVDLHKYLSADAVTNIEKWLTEPKYAEYKTELERMIADEHWNELEDAFFKTVEFGTGGRRGTTGVGSNRINRVTIGESTQALCEYIASIDDDAADKGIVIACDTRLTSKELSEYAAAVCAANGFKTYIFESFRATPELSFAVRHLKTAAGIVISASHNPPSDNGFKAYWSDGAQLVAPHDRGVLDKADIISTINVVEFDEAVNDGRIVVVGQEVDDAYITAVLNERVGEVTDLSIIYSPLHGAGQTNTLPVLQKAGFDVRTVDEQMVPDGNFPTIENGKPNPEEKAANDRAVALMLAEDADMAITNDPDADRVGVIVRQNDQAVYLTGNQAASLATDYALKKLQEKQQLGTSHYIAKTIVTTDMMEAIATKYGVKTYGNMLVGFKYIGELLRNKELTDEVFVIGGEESYGLLKGDYARDKDGASGALLLAEYAAELKRKGRTLVDQLHELYQEHGLYLERLDNLQCPGADGFKQMQAIMSSLRETPPVSIAGEQVSAVLDYKTLVRQDIATGEKTSIDCTSGNVLVYEFGDARRRVTIRPSGTEPKMKFYVQWHQDTEDPRKDYPIAMQQLENLSRELEGQALERA
ncbi:MAG TPA: phospho-sugar mutase [Candidatus Saccharimonadales bacterium]